MERTLRYPSIPVSYTHLDMEDRGWDQVDFVYVTGDAYVDHSSFGTAIISHMSNELKTPFRYDYVGSFLRPQALKDAKAQLRKNEISKEDYDKIVDEEVAKVVAKQKELGYHVITDGEFRRAFWHLDFMWGFEGVEHENTGGGIQFHGELALLDDTYLVGCLLYTSRCV